MQANRIAMSESCSQEVLGDQYPSFTCRNWFYWLTTKQCLKKQKMKRLSLRCKAKLKQRNEIKKGCFVAEYNDKNQRLVYKTYGT